MSEQVLNARITSAEIEIEDHGLLTLWVHMEHIEGSQGFGGYTVRDNLGLWVSELFRVFEVDKWSSLKGKLVRIRRDTLIRAVGHPIKELWFEPSTLYGGAK